MMFAAVRIAVITQHAAAGFGNGKMNFVVMKITDDLLKTIVGQKGSEGLHRVLMPRHHPFVCSF